MIRKCKVSKRSNCNYGKILISIGRLNQKLDGSGLSNDGLIPVILEFEFVDVELLFVSESIFAEIVVFVVGASETHAGT